MTKYYFGRNNLALTIYAPYDCDNACPFCTSKTCYKRFNSSPSDVLYQIERVFRDYSYPIKDVVFTGGEPTADVDILREMLSRIPGYVNVYINTTMPKKNFEAFAKLAENSSQIRGINVSRHGATYEEDCQDLNNICEDEFVHEFYVPIRINCVIHEDEIVKILPVLDRWEPYREDVGVCFRADYCNIVSDEDLHNPYDPIAMALNEETFYNGHTQCNVCDTLMFRTANGLQVHYHRGLRRSSLIHEDGTYEINDLIIFPDGSLTYDWEYTSVKQMHEIEKQYEKPPLLFSRSPIIPAYVSCASASSCGIGRAGGSCGASGCGGPSGCGIGMVFRSCGPSGCGG